MRRKEKKNKQTHHESETELSRAGGDGGVASGTLATQMIQSEEESRRWLLKTPNQNQGQDVYSLTSQKPIDTSPLMI